MTLRFLPAAEAELIRELRYFEKNARPGTAARFQAAVEAAARMATRHPLGGAPSCKGTRAYKLARFPFLLIYRVRSDETLIVALAPTSRKEGYWSGRKD